MVHALAAGAPSILYNRKRHACGWLAYSHVRGISSVLVCTCQGSEKDTISPLRRTRAYTVYPNDGIPRNTRLPLLPA